MSGTTAVGLDVTLHLFGEPDLVPKTSGAIVYRVVQEGITNALRYASGAPIWISVDCGPEITIDVVNGSSADSGSPLRAAGGGRGLPGIEERVTLLGGSFDAGPARAGAWRVSVRLPRV